MGAKNHAVVMSDAHQEATISALTGAAFGAAGQRCMAVSAAVFVGGIGPWKDALVAKASGLKASIIFNQGTRLFSIKGLDCDRSRDSMNDMMLCLSVPLHYSPPLRRPSSVSAYGQLQSQNKTKRTDERGCKGTCMWCLHTYLAKELGVLQCGTFSVPCVCTLCAPHSMRILARCPSLYRPLPQASDVSYQRRQSVVCQTGGVSLLMP